MWGAYYHHSIWDFLGETSFILFCFGNIKKKSACFKKEERELLERVLKFEKTYDVPQFLATTQEMAE